LISVRSEVQILPGPPPTQRCASRSEDAALGQARARLFLNRAAHAGGASTVAAARRNQSCAGGVAQLGERLLCKQEVIGSIPFTSTTDRTMRSNVRVKARQRRSCAARGEARRRARARLSADRGEADLAIGHDARWRLIFDRVNREYLSSMIGCGGAVTSVIRRQWPVVCSGEECLHARRVARGWRGMIDGEGMSVLCLVASSVVGL
jgi:hypothetical protein